MRFYSYFPEEELHYPLDIDLTNVSQYFISKFLYPSKNIGHILPSMHIAPINIFAFKFTHQIKPQCIKETFVFLIKSSFRNSENRQIIRQFFKLQKKISKHSFRWFFFIGMKTMKEEKSSVDEEVQSHSDMVQVNFVDNYRNNTLKLMSEMYWMRDYLCLNENTQRFIFMDDDVVINFANLGHLLSRKFENDAIFGYLNLGASPFRWPWSKWRISIEEYNGNYYPPYISGATVVMNKMTLLTISFAMPFVKYFPFDDVYMGIVAKKTGVKVINEEMIVIDSKCGSMCEEEINVKIAVHIPENKDLLKVYYNNL